MPSTRGRRDIDGFNETTVEVDPPLLDLDEHRAETALPDVAEHPLGSELQFDLRRGAWP